MEGLISVIIPVFNGERVIGKCLSSICSQTYKNIEIIVVDNGSTDRTHDVCELIKNNDERIVIVDELQKGVSNARNKGLSMAKGEYVCFIDADDWVDADYFSMLIEEIGEYDVICCDFVEEYENETIKKRLYHRPESMSVFVDDKQKLYSVEKSFIFTYTIWAKLYKRSAIGKHRFNDYSYSEDSIFFRELMFSDLKVKYINYRGYHYYINSESVTVKKKGRQLEIVEGSLELLFLTWEYANKMNNKTETIDEQLITCATSYLKSNIKRFRFGSKNGRKKILNIVQKMKDGSIRYSFLFMVLSLPMRIAHNCNRLN